jgi:small subunit ribosomal protein S8
MNPVSEMLATIKNGLKAKKDQIEIPYSAFKFAIAQVFKEKGLIRAVKKNEDNLIIKLKYNTDGSLLIREIKAISAPSRRVYVSSSEIPRVKSGYGFVIISTSQGVMDGAKAKKLHIGGELICKAW